MPNVPNPTKKETDHPFIRLLKTIFDESNDLNSELHEKVEKIKEWRKMSLHLSITRDVIGASARKDHDYIVPKEMLFAVGTSLHNVPKNKMREVVCGTYMPNSQELERITQNFGMPPDAIRTRHFMQLGEDYIEYRDGLKKQHEEEATEANTQTGDRKHVQLAKPRALEFTAQPELTTLGQALKNLRNSRVLVSGTIMHKVPGKGKPVTKEELRKGIDATSITTIVRLESDKLPINKSTWTMLIDPALKFLKAEGEREKIEALFNKALGSDIACVA